MCDCDIEFPDYDEESDEVLYEEREVAAAQSITCCECSHDISQDTTYKHIRGCWGGEWRTYHQCLDCAKLGDRFIKETGCCYGYGGLYQELIDSDILDRFGKDKAWFEQEPWLKITCQEPLKCEVV